MYLRPWLLTAVVKQKTGPRQGGGPLLWRITMHRLISLVSAICSFLFLLALPASADKGGVVRFATLPASSPGHPEGIAADAGGNIYAATFSFAGQNLIHIYRLRIC